MQRMKFVAFALSCAVVSSAFAFDWPAAGGTAVIPAGELVEVTGSIAAPAACGEIIINEGATLSLTNFTAGATFAGKISGSGKFLAANASKTNKRLTINGDWSEFTGDLELNHVFASIFYAEVRYVSHQDRYFRKYGNRLFWRIREHVLQSARYERRRQLRA